MAIALTSFQGLCGFRPVEEIVTFLKSKVETDAEGMHLGYVGNLGQSRNSSREQRTYVRTEGLFGLMRQC
jgi:mannose-6-phosphate isomerase class I